ncbi:MAG: hypothetical protein L0332_31970 [Chloroflexi bacterium]|nr:hypothetical protein [Chloroflexota bacterium]MCI0731320.1 hypothetical protein [Chloroflexota bacterium]
MQLIEELSKTIREPFNSALNHFGEGIVTCEKFDSCGRISYNLEATYSFAVSNNPINITSPGSSAGYAGLVILLSGLTPSLRRHTMLDVYIGFMDEEVNQLLTLLIDAYSDKRPILAVERGRIDEKSDLFERPFNLYHVQPKDLTFTYVGGEKAWKPLASKPSLEGRLAAHLWKELFGSDFFKEKIYPRISEAEPLKVSFGTTPTMTILRFNKVQEGNPIIMLRNPEMGTQPSLVRPYMRAVMKAISQLEETREKGFWLSSFASGGAINPETRPGFINRVAASLFIGSEYANGRVYGVVQLMALVPAKKGYYRPQHYEFFREESAVTAEIEEGNLSSLEEKTIKEAKTQAEKQAEAFVVEANDPMFVAVLRHLHEIYQDQKVDKLPLKEGPGASKHPEITASFSYFDSLKTKAAIWENLKGTVVNSNMEDYHVLRVFRSMYERGGQSTQKYTQPSGINILRVNANVRVQPSIVEAVKEWLAIASKEGVSQKFYRDAIWWGLSGCLKELVPELPGEANQWLIKLASEGDEIYTFEISKKKYCMHPFFCEIATDLLKDLKGGKGLTGKYAKNIGEFQSKAKDIYDAWKRGEKEVAGNLVEGLVNELCSGPFQVEELEKERYGIWLRPGKWKDADAKIEVKSHVLDGEALTEFTKGEENALLDRLLYKSANLIALQNLAAAAVQPDV